jgi:ABC-type antimicrobial peptide transport system permease subunit
MAGAVSVLVVAIALGILSHFALQQAIGFDPWLAILVLVVATALAVATAYLAARAPIRVRPLEALRNE